MRNFYLHTPDGARIGVSRVLRVPTGASYICPYFHAGVWHILPLSILEKHGMTEELPEEAFDEALRYASVVMGLKKSDMLTAPIRDPKHCVTLYMHGNSGNRILGHRKHFARHVSSGNLDMNVILFDYRSVVLYLSGKRSKGLYTFCSTVDLRTHRT